MAEYRFAAAGHAYQKRPGALKDYLPYARGVTSPEVEAETAGISRTFSEAPAPALAGADMVRPPLIESLRNPGIPFFRKLGNAIVDWHCTRASAAIGSAVVAFWTGPAGGQAAASATAMGQEAICPNFARAASLANQLSITRNEAMRLIRARVVVWDAAQGMWVPNTTWNLMRMAFGPYVPYAAVGALALAGIWLWKRS